MNILQRLEKTSFKKIVGISLFAAIALATPVTVWVSQQQTRLASKAIFEKPEIIESIQKVGAPSEGQPQIQLIWPFLGKVGDAVLIEGENLGNNPAQKEIKLGNLIVPETNINRWTPQLIEFTIPASAVSSPISLTIAGKKASWPYFFTVYDLNTPVQITENNDIVQVLNAPQGSTIEIYFSDGERIASDQLNKVMVPADKTILTLVVKDASNQNIPFFVEPEEFGF